MEKRRPPNSIGSSRGRAKLDAEKELKVWIPVRQHVQLHALKVLRGQTLSETVKAALGAYLDLCLASHPALPAGVAEEGPLPSRFSRKP